MDFPQELVDLGVNLESRNFFGESPLHCSSRDGQSEIVLMLLAAGKSGRAAQVALGVFMKIGGLSAFYLRDLCTC